MRRFLLIALCLPALAAAQGVRFDQYNMTSSNAVPFGAQAPIYTLPNSKVTVCAYPDDGGQPCGNVIPIYSDPALTQTADNPITADVHGRFGLWLAAGTYTYSVVTQGGVFVGTYIFTLGGAGGTGCLTTGILAGDIMFPDVSGNCVGSDNINAVGAVGGTNGSDELVLKTPSVALGDDINLQLLSAIRPNQNQTSFAPHLWKMNCENTGNSNKGCQIDLEVNDGGVPDSTHGGLVPLFMDMTAEWGGTHPNYGGINIVQNGNGLTATGLAYYGIDVQQTIQSGLWKQITGYEFDTQWGAGALTATDYDAFLIQYPTSQTPLAGYCDFLSRTGRAGDGPEYMKLNCGPSHTSIFPGAVTATIYTETLTTPASSSAACTAGQFTDDASFHYVCVALNTWKRVALSSF